MTDMTDMKWHGRRWHVMECCDIADMNDMTDLTNMTDVTNMTGCDQHDWHDMTIQNVKCIDVINWNKVKKKLFIV